MSARAWCVRLAVLAAAAFLLTGPAPGSAGGCGQEADRAGALEFCIERDRRLLQRQFFRGQSGMATDLPKIETQAQRDACLQGLEEKCQRDTTDRWPFNCLPAPTVQEMDACLEELELLSTLDLSIEEIGACYLCDRVRREPMCPEDFQ